MYINLSVQKRIGAESFFKRMMGKTDQRVLLSIVNWYCSHGYYLIFAALLFHDQHYLHLRVK